MASDRSREVLAAACETAGLSSAEELLFHGLVGTLQRHGLAIYESNVDNSSALRLESYKPDMQRPYVEPTELGEHVWLRFYKAGANVPDVWTASALSLEG